MASDVLDFAGLESAAAASDSGADQIDSGAEQIEETPVEGAEGASEAGGEADKEGEGQPEGGKEGEEQSGEKKEGAAKDEKLPGNKNTPQNIRKTLKAIQDADPANKEAVKTLHGAYERWNAAQQIFPKGIQEMKDVKALVDLIGGQEGFETLQAQKAAIEAIDQKVYNSDPTLVDDIINDLKEANKLEAFPKLAMNFLNRLQKDNSEAYYDQMIPHFVGLLEEVNIPGVFAGLVNVLSGIKADSKPEDITAAVTRALGIASKADTWAKNMQSQNKKAKETEVSPEQKKFEEERKKFEAEKNQFKTNQTETFKKDVATSTGKVDSTELGKALGPFLKMPFFKGFTRENLSPLASTIQSNLLSELKNDKIYQAQMKALWGAKEPAKDKIVAYHESKVRDIAQRIVRSTVERMYPGYAKGSAATGRVAAQAEKKAATQKSEQQSVQSGKPIFVPTKPKDLVRNTDVIIGNKTYKASDLTTLEITGKGFVKSADGKSFKLVTWRK